MAIAATTAESFLLTGRLYWLLAGAAEKTYCVPVSLFRRFLQPESSDVHIRANALSVQISPTKIVLSYRVSLLRSLPRPFNALGEVLPCSTTLKVKDS
jgi:hypothetical protein